MLKDEFKTLSNGVKIPSIGFGTWQIQPGMDAYEATMEAIKAGYRHIDTAFAYGNEESIACAILDSGIERKDIFITTKLPADIKDVPSARRNFEESLKNLKTDYIDLYLVHAPWPWNYVGKNCLEENIELWKFFIELYRSKKVRAIGVSNFSDKDLQGLIKATGFVPHVNQIRFFISNIQKNTYEYCIKNNILVEAYSPLATGKILDNEKVKLIAENHHTDTSKICVRYCLSKGTLPLVKSTHKDRIISNLDNDIFLSDEEMKILDNIEEKEELKRPLRS